MKIKKIVAFALVLATSTFASDILDPADISTKFRTQLKASKAYFDTSEIVKSVKASKTTLAEIFVRFAIELCLQSLNQDEEAQKKALENGNDIFTGLISASIPVSNPSEQAPPITTVFTKKEDCSDRIYKPKLAIQIQNEEEENTKKKPATLKQLFDLEKAGPEINNKFSF